MEGDRWLGQLADSRPANFNPLPPHGGRPTSILFMLIRKSFQSTPSAWRETTSTACLCSNIFISIHSLRMEGDLRSFCRLAHWNISIHSLRMEGDDWRRQRRLFWAHFNPLPPHGGRLLPRAMRSQVSIFQSTPSAWRETG